MADAEKQAAIRTQACAHPEHPSARSRSKQSSARASALLARAARSILAAAAVVTNAPGRGLQVQYYLAESSVRRDMFLSRQLRSCGGAVALADLATYPLLKQARGPRLVCSQFR